MKVGTASLSSKRTRPTIWIKQIVLYKSIAPVDEIRSIPFTAGMNIIQGESNDSPDAFESGHGNGKTTLCRLIRYCLGEKTFGQRHVVEEVKHCFPEGYVGAVIEVGQQEWSVLRSLGNLGKDFAKPAIGLSELIRSDDSVSFQEFIKEVRSVALSSMSRREVLSAGALVQWLHLLAMCSRDQESRYDRFWNWRHARSDSRSPKLTKIDVSLCVRATLGILDLSEPLLRSRLAELEAELALSRQMVDKRKADPADQVSRLRILLSDELGVDGAMDASLDDREMFGLRYNSDQRIRELRKELAEILERIAPLDRQINMVAMQYREQLEMQERDEAASEVIQDGTAQTVNDLEELRSRHDWLLYRATRECKAGRILYGDCAHVQEHLLEIKQLTEEERSRTILEVSKRDQDAARRAEQAHRQESSLSRLRATLDELNGDKNDLMERRRMINDLLRRIPIAADQIVGWHRILTGEIGDEELFSLEASVSSTVDDIASIKTQLNEVLAQQNQRSQQFGRRFHEIVQKTMDATYQGAVVIKNDRILFRINRKRSLAGEAYESLAVLLADLAILFESSEPTVCHPGLLIHDSPREADLNLRLYERMLETAYSLMTDEAGNTPYQYIVTTTTPPPESLQRASVTMHTLSSGSGSLFGMQLEVNDSVQRTLLEATEDEE